MSLYALPGDVFFTRSTSLLGKLIRWAQTGPKEEKTWTNHTGLVTAAGWIKPPNDGRPHTYATVVESLWTTEEWYWYPNHQEELGSRIRVYRYRHMDRSSLAAVLSTARKFVGAKYGWWKLLVHLADRGLFQDKKTLTHFLGIDRRPICSYTVAKSFASAGINFGMHPETADPDEMMDWCESKDSWIFVGETYVG